VDSEHIKGYKSSKVTRTPQNVHPIFAFNALAPPTLNVGLGLPVDPALLVPFPLPVPVGTEL
jgi:hypothetical protein